jgi:hypothetical protein
MSTITTTIEPYETELDVQIAYQFQEGERRTWDYPGYPPHAELLWVKVLGRDGNRDDRSTDPLWEGWSILDKSAYEYVSNNWDRFQDMCLEDAAEREEAARDAAEEERFERRRLGE